MQFESTHGWVLLGKGRQALPPERAGRARREAGFVLSLWEVLIAVVIVALVFGTIINGYLAGAVKMEWTGYSLAAQSLSAQTVEQARSAVWDIALGKNQLTNMIAGGNVVQSLSSYNSTTLTATIVLTNIMDVPWKGTNATIATNYVTIQTVSETGTLGTTVQLQFVRVDTVWPFTGWANHTLSYYTNTTCTYIAPDNRDPTTLGQ
jgi:hypothetical protein